MSQDRTTKIWSLLGFARRARKVMSGREAVLGALRCRKAYLVLVAEDAPEDLRETVEQEGERLQIPVKTYGRKADLGLALGQSPRSVVAILARDFAESILKEVEEITAGEAAVIRRRVDGGDDGGQSTGL